MIFNIAHELLLRLDQWWDKKLHLREMRKWGAMSDEELEKIAGVDGIADEGERLAALKRIAGGGA